MKLTMLFLLMLPVLALAGEQSIVKQNYIEDVQFQIELIVEKIRLQEATDFDRFKLQKLQARLNTLSEPFVATAQFTTNVVDRVPVDAVEGLDGSLSEVYYYTDLRNLSGQVVKHVWIESGEIVFEKEFKVKGDRWRVWSQKSANGHAMRVLVYADGRLISAKELPKK